MRRNYYKPFVLGYKEEEPGEGRTDALVDVNLQMCQSQAGGMPEELLSPWHPRDTRGREPGEAAWHHITNPTPP